MGSAKVFRHRHKQNVRKFLSWIKHFGIGDASRQCHSTFIIQSEMHDNHFPCMRPPCSDFLRKSADLPADAERRSSGCVRSLQSARSNHRQHDCISIKPAMQAAQTRPAFRREATVRRRFFQAGKPLPCTDDGSPKRHVGEQLVLLGRIARIVHIAAICGEPKRSTNATVAKR